MIEVHRTNDPVEMSFVQAVLKEAGIKTFVTDDQTSSLYGGSLKQLRPRLMVADDDAEEAKRLLKEAFAEIAKSEGA
ncbi:MAG: hypothetical protein CMF74_08885 [Maricaulis sp.]|jgi:hypothetical protein|nr:hypothetical protein [Maricaulis sp.]HAQ36477.1 DUF2007 domain-containing protein [Alphaproteobacteria bacterium]|tara:strand:- start:129 stop:359 length:231 start_codon:yes stop_codon:yes gene_type:complete